MSVGYSIPILMRTVGGTQIIANCLAGIAGLDSKQQVTLGGTAYIRSPPPEFPCADTGVAAYTSLLNGPHTIPGGTILTVFDCEALALIAAGAATAT
jgi:hypothetical protein